MGWSDKVKEARQLTMLELRVTCLIKQRFDTLVVLEEDLWRQRAKVK